jgi:hypothetical protein
MKTLFKVLFLQLALTLLFTQCEKDFNRPYFTITDEAFLNALIKKGVDTNGDSNISPAEAEAVDSLNVNGFHCGNTWCYHGEIESLMGIEAFTNLEVLFCGFNELTSLDVSNNTALTKLGCSNNQLASLDVSGCTSLTELDFRYNLLTSLDVSNNASLANLQCWRNHLTSLDVSGCTALTRLNCDHNELNSLDISNNTTLTHLSLGIIPTLYEVCVWTMPFPPEGFKLCMDGSPNVYFTTECSK